jgi:hypothetical protein
MIFWLENVIISDLLPQQKLVSPNNYIFGFPRMVISLAILTPHSNSLTYSSAVFPIYTYSDYSTMYHFPGSAHLKILPSISTPYVEEGENGSPGFLGGFVWEIEGVQEKVDEEWEEVKRVIGEKITWGRLIVELLHYNRYSHY